MAHTHRLMAIFQVEVSQLNLVPHAT